METTAPETTLHDLLPAWVAALDAVIDELHDDLVRRSIVHLTTLRDELLAVRQRPR